MKLLQIRALEGAVLEQLRGVVVDVPAPQVKLLQIRALEGAVLEQLRGVGEVGCR